MEKQANYSEIKTDHFDAHQICAKSFTCKNMQIVAGGVPGFIFDKEVVELSYSYKYLTIN